MSYANRLKKLKDQWGKSKPAKGMQQLPAGKYQFLIKTCKLEESKANFNKGHLQVVYGLEVATGELKGKKAFIRVDLESTGRKDPPIPPGMDIWKGQLETLGVEIPSQLSEEAIKETLQSLVGVIFNGACVHNAKGYANIYINDLVNAPPQSDDDEEEEDEEEVEEEEDEDDDEEDDDSEEEEEEEEEEVKPKKKAAPAPTPSDSKKKFAISGKVTPVKKKAEPVKEEAEEDDDEDWSGEFDDD